jgi:hypothetical protein
MYYSFERIWKKAVVTMCVLSQPLPEGTEELSKNRKKERKKERTKETWVRIFGDAAKVRRGHF